MTKNEDYDCINRVAEITAYLELIKPHLNSMDHSLDRFKNGIELPGLYSEVTHAYLDARLIIEYIVLLTVSAHSVFGKRLTKAIIDSWNAEKTIALLNRHEGVYLPEAKMIVNEKEELIEKGLIEESEQVKDVNQVLDVNYPVLDIKVMKRMYSKCGSNLHGSRHSSLHLSKVHKENQKIPTKMEKGFGQSFVDLKEFRMLAGNFLKCFQIKLPELSRVAICILDIEGDVLRVILGEI